MTVRIDGGNATGTYYMVLRFKYYIIHTVTYTGIHRNRTVNVYHWYIIYTHME